MKPSHSLLTEKPSSIWEPPESADAARSIHRARSPGPFCRFHAGRGIGVFIHLLTLTLLFKGLSLGFVQSQGIGTLIAMTGNFALNKSSLIVTFA